MRNRTDLTGKYFGKRVVLGYAGQHTYPSGVIHTLWRVKCECGRIDTVSYTSLVKSSVCRQCSLVALHHKGRGRQVPAAVMLGRASGKQRGRPVRDLTGLVIGRRTVLGVSAVQPPNTEDVHWDVQCSCGRIDSVGKSNLTRRKPRKMCVDCRNNLAWQETQEIGAD